MKILLICFWFLAFHQKQFTLRVGTKYTICSLKIDEGNPFETRTRATVIITAMKKGYVQYCWASDYKKNDKPLFSRSEKEFYELIKNCDGTNR
jgi:hypothetical protein